jgi:hypothetical protein
MSVAKYSMKLEWKEFNLDMNSVEAWMENNAGEHYCGNSAGSALELHFEEEPSQAEKDAIAAYWAALEEESDEALVYQSKAERDADKAAKKAAGKAKLLALGLTEDEIAALVG